jgi:flavin reductase (DIM6/NTAB) family NADH-FMN oxidoreductase RutF
MVDGSIVSFECEVVRSVDLVEYDQGYPRAHTLFIVEVKKVWANKNDIKDNAPDYMTIKPIIWTISPNNYWTIGENKGSAFNQNNRKLVPKKK